MASAWGKSWGAAFAQAWGRATPQPATTPIVAPTYKDIATRVFSGQATGAQNIIYARIGRRRTGPN